MDITTGMDVFLLAAGVGIATLLFFVGLYSENIIKSIMNGIVSKARDIRIAEEDRTVRAKLEHETAQLLTERARLELETERERNRHRDHQV